MDHAPKSWPLGNFVLFIVNWSGSMERRLAWCTPVSRIAFHEALCSGNELMHSYNCMRMWMMLHVS